MKADEIFKRYDVRGKYPEELNENFASRIGKALGQLLNEDERFEKQVVIGRDNKQSSEILQENLVKGLKSTGIKVLKAGVGPTDFTAFHGVKNDSVSVQVTASHMPLNFNGFKFMYPEGNGFVNEDLNKIEEKFREKDFPLETGSVEELSDTREIYLKSLEDYAKKFRQTEDRKIIVDTLGGASTGYLPEILERLGFEVVNIADEKDIEGPYYDPPNPKPEILDHIPQRMKDEDADIGLATDMDADRVKVYYNDRWLSGDELFLIFAQLLEGEVAASIDTTSALRDFVKEVHYTRVGDPFVVDKTLEENAVLSGEPNGHYCFPEFTAYNSGTLSAVLAAATDLNTLIDQIPELFIEKANLEVEEKEKVMSRVIGDVKTHYDVLSDKDGVKFSVDSSSVLIRPSGSSPVIRIKVESETEGKGIEVLEEIEKLVRKNI